MKNLTKAEPSETKDGESDRLTPTLLLLDKLFYQTDQDSILQRVENPQEALDLLLLQISNLSKYRESCKDGSIEIEPLSRKDFPHAVGQVAGFHISYTDICDEPVFGQSRSFFLFTVDGYRGQIPENEHRIWYVLRGAGDGLEFASAYGGWGSGTTNVLLVSYRSWSGGSREMRLHHFSAIEDDKGGVSLAPISN